MTTFSKAIPQEHEHNRPAVPAALTREVGYILAAHKGLDRALRRDRILQLVKMQPQFKHTTDRQIRGAIESLREAGELICSLGADSEGYYMAADMREYQEFRQVYLSYARTIQDRARKMDQEAARRFGANPLQDRLI